MIIYVLDLLTPGLRCYHITVRNIWPRAATGNSRCCAGQLPDERLVHKIEALSEANKSSQTLVYDDLTIMNEA